MTNETAESGQGSFALRLRALEAEVATLRQVVDYLEERMRAMKSREAPR